MDTVTRRGALATGAALVLVACSEAEPAAMGAGDAAKLAAVEEETRAVSAWVEQNRGALPTDYDDLSRLPSAYRLAALLALPPVHASALVQEHLRRSVAARPEMTAAQRAPRRGAGRDGGTTRGAAPLGGARVARLVRARDHVDDARRGRAPPTPGIRR